ncbi:MAG: IS110 family transposase [Phycisphaera sp. RhM]|nr:IS110 family transposase [Phycisphaera sp. RhM]
MLYLGIDQHAKQLTLSLRGSDGNVILNRQVSTEPKRFEEFFNGLKSRAEADGYFAIVEVCGFNDWLLLALPNFGCTEVILIQPEKKPKVKTDRRDAHALSELLWINRERIANRLPIRGVRQVIAASPIDAENQRITLLRQQAGRQRTRATNQIKHILRRHNLQWSMPTKTFPTLKAIAWLKTVKLPSWDRTEMDYHLGEFERLTTRMKSLEETIVSRGQGIEEVELLRTIPGCGYYSALALASRIGDAKRFPRGKSLANYWGLTPGVRDSGDAKGRRGHITKTGSTMARWLLAQVTQHVLRRDPVMKQWYKPIRARRGSRIARTAVMRRMSVIIRNMLVEKQSYTECRDAMIARRKSQLKTRNKRAA